MRTSFVDTHLQRKANFLAYRKHFDIKIVETFEIMLPSFAWFTMDLHGAFGSGLSTQCTNL